MKRLWPIGVFLLHGCAEPALHFRGYTELSECRGVIEAEVDGGSRFQDAVDEDLPLGDGLVMRLSGELFSLPVQIFVTCYRDGDVVAIDYIAEAADADGSAAMFSTLARELDALFGGASESITGDSRSRVYHCGDPITVILREARHGETDFEIALLLIPRPGECRNA